MPSWTTAHREFSTQVKSLLLALGFPTTTRQGMSGWGQSTLYVLRLLNISYSGAFRSEIGFIGARKHEAIKIGGASQAARYDYIYLQEPVLARSLAMTRERDAVALSVQRHGAGTRSSLLGLYAEAQDLR